MWIDNSVFYQIYPIGFCGAPRNNEGGEPVPRILKVIEWTEHIKKLGVDAVYFSPIFESDSHGYNTRDFMNIDRRLGTNEDFARVCRHLHENGIRVVLDGVFNHVGRGFWAFQDVLKNRESSKYRYWFNINLGQNNAYNDGLSYEAWEGCYDLVKLNLSNPEVRGHIFDAIRAWVNEFDIDGLRLDVAYCLDREFLKQLRGFCNGLNRDFPLIGEVLFGDYNLIVNDGMLHSCTNYECYKGIYSSFNALNMFEISYSLNRQFGYENWTIYKGKHLLCFADNHDVSRIASQLKDKRHLPLVYGLLFGMPGVPCVYYGSEWGATGDKKGGDDSLRPCFEAPEETALTGLIARLAAIHKLPAVSFGGYRNLAVANQQLVFERAFEGRRVIVAINAGDSEYYARFGGIANGTNLITGTAEDTSNGFALAPMSLNVWSDGE